MKKVTTQTQQLTESIDKANKHLFEFMFDINICTRKVLLEKTGHQSKAKLSNPYKKYIKQINQAQKHLSRIKSLIENL